MVELKHRTFGSVGQTVQGGEQAPAQTAQQERPMNKVDLRSLIELGCVRDDVVVGSMTFTMRSLNAAERLEAANFIGAEETDTQKLFDFNILVLSMSLESVNGTPLEQLYNGTEEIDILSARKAIVSSLQNSVLAELLGFYTEVTDRADSQFTGEQVKN